MRQLQLMAFGEPSDVIQLNTLPEPTLGPEDVLVSMEAAPLNPSDFLLVRGIYALRPPLPFSLGAEGVGRVTKTGSKVKTALLGKRVVIPVRNTVPVANDTDPLQLAMIGINPATAYLLLHRYVSLMPGDWIGQTAANSAMGQYIIALARLAGVKTLNVVRRPDAAEQVRQFGGDRAVLQGDNLRRDIDKALGGKKLSLVLDFLGGSPTGELARSLKPGGSIAVYAFQHGWPELSPEFLFNNLNLHGFWIGNWIRNAPRMEIQELYQKLADLVADGSLSAAVEHLYPLDQFKEAIDRSLKSTRCGKILFELDSD